MNDFFKNNKVILFFILILAFGLRYWESYSPVGFWESEFIKYSFNFPFDFFGAIKTNCYAPLHWYYVKLWNIIFDKIPFISHLSSLFASFCGCFVMYLVGKNYQTKDNSTKIGLVCALISAISSFLILFAQEAKIYSVVFLLASLTLLYSIKMYENPSKKNKIWFSIFSILLILEHTIGFIYVIFNIFGLIAYKNRKKSKNDKDMFIPIVAGLILCLPLVPFIFRIFLHPTFITKWWSPFDWSRIFFTFTDFFSPVLRNITISSKDFFSQIASMGSFDFEFIIFAIIPASIAGFLIFKSNVESKKINKYFLSVVLAVFLTILTASVVGKIDFLTKYITELYPMMILMMSIGLYEINSSNVRISIITIYTFMNLFYFVISRLNLI